MLTSTCGVGRVVGCLRYLSIRGRDPNVSGASVDCLCSAAVVPAVLLFSLPWRAVLLSGQGHWTLWLLALRLDTTRNLTTTVQWQHQPAPESQVGVSGGVGWGWRWGWEVHPHPPSEPGTHDASTIWWAMAISEICIRAVIAFWSLYAWPPP